jgi:hypothetical protein
VDAYIHVLTSALVGGEWSASRPGRFNPGERAPCTHCIGECVGPRTGLDDVEKRQISGLELRPPLPRPARSHSLYRPHYPGFLPKGKQLLTLTFSSPEFGIAVYTLMFSDPTLGNCALKQECLLPFLLLFMERSGRQTQGETACPWPSNSSINFSRFVQHGANTRHSLS